MPCNNANYKKCFHSIKYTKFAVLSGRVNHVGEKCNVNECDIIPNTLVHSKLKNILSNLQCKFFLYHY